MASTCTIPSSPGHDQRQQPRNRRQTHESLREAASRGTERKARALSKHRNALVRWTAAGSGTPQRRQHFKSATTAAVHRSEEVRLQSDRVSPLLSLVSTESLGRHVVAAGTLPAGTELLTETPFAWSLHPEFSGEFCAHCLHEVRLHIYVDCLPPWFVGRVSKLPGTIYLLIHTP